MHIFDMSIELVREILEHAVLAVGITAAVKLRLVCHTFNKEIPVAMLNARLLEMEHRWLFFFPNKSWLVEEHIYRRTSSPNPGTENLSAAILLAANTLTSKNMSTQGRESEHEQDAIKPYIRELSRAAAWNMGTRSILHYLQSNTSAEKKYLHHLSSTNLIEAAAAHLGDLDFFIKLVKEQGVIDASENVYFGNPLRSAILQDHFDLAVFLLDNGVDVNHGEWGKGFGKTALQAAASTGQHRFVELLLDPRYGCRTSGREFDSAVLDAVSAGHLPIMSYLMERANMVVTPEFCNRVLLEAAKYGREDIVKFALQMGADPNKGEGCNRWQVPITVAARYGYISIVRILLESGATVKIGGRHDTMAAITRREGREGVRRVLREHMN
ncbi:ankyrin repeat-containing domain protein [Leptodontidium sp. 2 PMI_412]|nr:ankyrin repeat-containing domain protein [Leptodontidium sp. 2 PMI_412]